MIKIATAVAAVALMAGTIGASQAQDMEEMTFFITSAGSGDGANLGGIAGADAICATLAATAGADGKTWRAYLSTADENARDRIGSGPWHNAKGELIATDVATLHDDPNINKETGLTESGNPVNGRGDTPNQHDILTGSNADGTLAGADMTCGDWTLNGEGSAMVGHHDRVGLRDDAPSKSWNASHPSRGCSQEALIGTGGNGYFYCFAAN